MNIDDGIEALVREVLASVVKQDLDRLAAAFSAIGDGEPAARAIELALAIGNCVLRDTFKRQPTPAELDTLADEITHGEEWARVSRSEVATMLNTIALGASRFDQGLPAEEAMTLPFIIAANLLASNADAEDGKWWFNYLDRVEAVLEQQG
jgi:hypothetical protein